MEMRYNAEELEEYVVDILTMGLSQMFLPAGFVREENILIASFRTEGYRPLSAIVEMHTEDVLKAALSLLQGAGQGEKVYLLPEYYEVRSDCIFVDKGFDRVRMIFVPSETPLSFSEKLADLLDDLKERSHEEGRRYVEDAAEYVRRHPWSSRSVRHHLETLRREVYLCGVQ
ncbi:MAG: hypothetical protein ACI4LA_06840 [Emergencia sp.]